MITVNFEFKPYNLYQFLVKYQEKKLFISVRDQSFTV